MLRRRYRVRSQSNHRDTAGVPQNVGWADYHVEIVLGGERLHFPVRSNWNKTPDRLLRGPSETLDGTCLRQASGTPNAIQAT